MGARKTNKTVIKFEFKAFATQTKVSLSFRFHFAIEFAERLFCSAIIWEELICPTIISE